MEAGSGAEPRDDAPDDATSDGAAALARHQLAELVATARALSSERDIGTLLGLILRKSRELCGADAGSVYVVEDVEDDGVRGPSGSGEKQLHFMLSQNDSIPIDFKAFRLPIDEKSIVGKATLTARPINIPHMDRLNDPAQNPSGVRHNRSFDDRTGYRAVSMLTVPMLSARNDVIGVIQLINRKRDHARKLLAAEDFDAQVIPFDQPAEDLALAFASQAGVCLENAILYDEIRNLFEGFVDAAVTAIEARDPTTSGHSRRVATLAVGLAETVDRLSDGRFREVRFSREDLRQLEYAGVLHDFGKVGVREEVLVKAKKLYTWQRDAIAQRFKYIRKAIEAEAWRRKCEVLQAGGAGAADRMAAIDAEAAAQVARLDADWMIISRANEPTVLEQPLVDRLEELGRRSYVDIDGSSRPYLEASEIGALEVTRGSLTRAERDQIQSHVSHTIAFLETIPWGRTFRNIPRIAGGHHEQLDGSGYPRGLRAEQIPLETRMLTISDIFDALTAQDRPYKAAMPVQRALGILEADARAGKVDSDLFQVFVGAQVWQRVF